MKSKKIIVFLIITNIILIGIICSLVRKSANVIRKEAITIKEMSETEYDSSITELNKSHEDYATQVQANKKRLAQAISNENVETSENATVDEMVTNIGRILQARTADATATAEDIAKGKTAYIKGELITGTSTYSKLKVGTITKSNSSLFEIPANFEPDIIILYGTATSNYQFSVIYANSEINIVGWYAGDGATYKIQNLLFQNDIVSFEINYPYGTNSTMYGGTFNYILAKK